MDWLFAYGSLLPAGASALPDGAVPANLVGWRRSWAVAMDNSVDLPGYKHYVTADGRRPAVMVCYLDIAEHPGGVVNGVALAVGADELPGLDARERNYERRDISGALDVALDGRVWVYTGTRAGRIRAGQGRRERRLMIAGDYHERVMAGFELLGERGRFEALTEPRAAPVMELTVVYHAPVAEPRSARGCD